MLRLQQGNVTSDACIDLIQVPKTNVSIKKKTLNHQYGKKQYQRHIPFNALN